MRNRIATAVAASVAAIGLVSASGGTASAEPSGNYDYVCVSTNGTSYTMADGEKLSNCKGSYLQKYINGQQVETVHLTGQGTPASPNQLDGYCIVGLALGGTAAIVFPPAGAAELVFAAASGVLTLADCLA
ncbi:hypothetical protein [Aeromicrobium sp. P5_D10]